MMRSAFIAVHTLRHERSPGAVYELDPMSHILEIGEERRLCIPVHIFRSKGHPELDHRCHPAHISRIASDTVAG